jgi:hypothetical protein
MRREEKGSELIWAGFVLSTEISSLPLREDGKCVEGLSSDNWAKALHSFCAMKDADVGDRE